MKKVPRELRQLIINDRPVLSITKDQREKCKRTLADPTKSEEERTEARRILGIELITGWPDVQHFWRRDHMEQPDIVLCDINFDTDINSPLHLVSSFKPTGLLYALPFLALAKANTLPIVLKFHTGDPTLFSRLHSQQDIHEGTKPPHVMSYLAAELGGVVMAMLGSEIPSGTITIDATWAWLGARVETFETEEGARVAARKEYRRKLVTMCQPSAAPAIVVDPDGYQELVQWFEAMASKAVIADSDWANAPGLVLFRRDGSRDSIAIRSLFNTDDRFVPEKFRVQANCGDTSIPADAWLSKREVRVGEFIYALGDWPRIYECAAAAVRHFPCGGTPSPKKLRSVIPESLPGHKLSRLVALLFQSVRLFWSARDEWRRLYSDTEWNPKTRTFGETREDNTLQEHLKKAYRHLRTASGWSKPVPISEHSIMEQLAAHQWGGLQDQGRDFSHLAAWVHFHIDLLVTLGVAQKTSDGYQILPKSFPAELPPCPPEFRPNWIKAFVAGLGESLGSKPGDETSELRRIPAQALFDGSDRDGTEFIDRMRGGLIPGWLRELGREYAINELQWPPDCHWPDFLK